MAARETTRGKHRHVEGRSARLRYATRGTRHRKIQRTVRRIRTHSTQKGKIRTRSRCKCHTSDPIQQICRMGRNILHRQRQTIRKALPKHLQQQQRSLPQGHVATTTKLMEIRTRVRTPITTQVGQNKHPHIHRQISQTME